MIDSKVLFDTAPIIYLVEKNPHYQEVVTLFLAEAIQKDVSLITSVLTMAEATVMPKRFDRTDLVTKFEHTLKALFEVHPISWHVAEISATLRAKYTALRHRFPSNSLRHSK